MDYKKIKCVEDLQEYGKEILEDISEEVNCDWDIMQICSDDFYIIETWESFNEINTALFSRIPEIENWLPFRDKNYPSDWFEYISNSNWSFSDEYIKCAECGKHLERYVYWGTPDYEIVGDEYLCYDCLENNKELKSWHFDNMVNCFSKSANFFGDDYIIEKGFHKLEESHDCGWYDDCDNVKPKDVFERLKEKFDVVFKISEIHQWHTAYDVWVKAKE